ncbi:hypothetical protein ACQUW5_14500 [Legionella sp. CNM-1927-20]|uniref:hypothetical protein n=1 Tax=Legionella sp. CNM-1927-20 TaxID=3422221 RepID=UPI00403AD5E7
MDTLKINLNPLIINRISSALTLLKGNFLKIAFLIFSVWYFYQIHLDVLEHASDKYISISQALESVNSTFLINQTACNAALENIKKSKSS